MTVVRGRRLGMVHRKSGAIGQFETAGYPHDACTIWTEGVREIISADDADVKFIISDHPVTIYNHAVPPDARTCAYSHDPTIALKASQTIFPLTRDFCPRPRSRCDAWCLNAFETAPSVIVSRLRHQCRLCRIAMSERHAMRSVMHTVRPREQPL